MTLETRRVVIKKKEEKEKREGDHQDDNNNNSGSDEVKLDPRDGDLGDPKDSTTTSDTHRYKHTLFVTKYALTSTESNRTFLSTNRFAFPQPPLPPPHDTENPMFRESTSTPPPPPLQVHDYNSDNTNSASRIGADGKVTKDGDSKEEEEDGCYDTQVLSPVPNITLRLAGPKKKSSWTTLQIQAKLMAILNNSTKNKSKNKKVGAVTGGMNKDASGVGAHLASERVSTDTLR